MNQTTKDKLYQEIEDIFREGHESCTWYEKFKYSDCKVDIITKIIAKFGKQEKEVKDNVNKLIKMLKENKQMRKKEQEIKVEAVKDFTNFVYENYNGGEIGMGGDGEDLSINLLARLYLAQTDTDGGGKEV